MDWKKCSFKIQSIWKTIIHRLFFTSDVQVYYRSQSAILILPQPTALKIKHSGKFLFPLYPAQCWRSVVCIFSLKRSGSAPGNTSLLSAHRPEIQCDDKPKSTFYSFPASASCKNKVLKLPGYGRLAPVMNDTFFFSYKCSCRCCLIIFPLQVILSFKT